VCTTPSAPGRTFNAISVNGVLTTRIDAGQAVFFAANTQFFVEAYDQVSYDALRRGLGLTSLRC
jgi:hypothetical protein